MHITAGMVLGGLVIAAFLEFPILSFILGVCLAWPWIGYPFFIVLAAVVAIILFNVLSDFISDLGPKSATDKIYMYTKKDKKKPKKTETPAQKRRREERAAEAFFRELEEESSEHAPQAAAHHH